jgi:HPt (histidine-containing phosphotransfer) domain-containing protein
MIFCLIPFTKTDNTKKQQINKILFQFYQIPIIVFLSFKIYSSFISSPIFIKFVPFKTILKNSFMPNQHECIDLSYLESIAEGDKSIIEELITIFLDQIPEFTEGLDKNFAERRWLDVAAIAHKAKSSVISIGLKHLGNHDLKNLELVAKELYVQSIKSKATPDAGEAKEAEQLSNFLRGYDKKRQDWIIKNASPQTVEAIIKKFKITLKQAEEELKTEIEK